VQILTYFEGAISRELQSQMKRLRYQQHRQISERSRKIYLVTSGAREARNRRKSKKLKMRLSRLFEGLVFLVKKGSALVLRWKIGSQIFSFVADQKIYLTKWENRSEIDVI